MKRLGAVAVLLAIGIIGVRADDVSPPTTKPTTQAAIPPTPTRRTAGRLTQPWSRLTTLTEEQRAQIIDLHRTALDAKKAIDQKERSDIVALLTDAQKLELLETEDKTTVQRKLAQRPADAGMGSGK